MKEPEARAPLRNPPLGEPLAQRSQKQRHPALIVAAIVGLALCAWFLIHLFTASKKGPAAPAGIPVSTGLAQTGSIDIYLDALGTVTPVYTVTLTSRVAGELTQVLYKEGQMVRRGDLLAVIDPRPYTALLTQAQGQLARDEALLKNARLDLVRYQNAFQQHAIPEQQLATQQALVEQYLGVVELDRGNMASAQVNVDYTRIVSPIDGRVGLRSVDPGNIVAADGTTGLATITQLQPITVIFTISEDDLTQVTEQTSAGRTLQGVRARPLAAAQARRGHAHHARQPDQPDDGDGPRKGDVPEPEERALPQPVRQREAARQDPDQRGPRPGRRDPAQHRRRPSSMSCSPTATVKSRDVKIVATEGETRRRSPGSRRASSW